MKLKALLMAVICSVSPAIAMETTPSQTPQTTNATQQETPKMSVGQMFQASCVRNTIIAAVTGAALPYAEKIHPVVALLFFLHQLQQME